MDKIKHRSHPGKHSGKVQEHGKLRGAVVVCEAAEELVAANSQLSVMGDTDQRGVDKTNQVRLRILRIEHKHDCLNSIRTSWDENLLQLGPQTVPSV